MSEETKNDGQPEEVTMVKIPVVECGVIQTTGFLS